LKFEKTTPADLGRIRELSPAEWGIDITPSIKEYLDWDFCHSVKLVDNNEIIGIGTAIFYANTSWLAHIIVDEKHRNKGHGTNILNYLVDYCKNSGYKTILLIASPKGYPLYKKFGFLTQTEYVKYEKTNDIEYSPNINIKNIEPNDYEKILALDKYVSGEDRQNILLKFVKEGFVYKKNEEISGFYLHNLHEGLIIATDEEAGLELLKLRSSQNKYSVIPVENIVGNNYLKENNYKETMRIKRMIHGSEIECKCECIYNRIAGNFG